MSWEHSNTGIIENQTIQKDSVFMDANLWSMGVPFSLTSFLLKMCKFHAVAVPKRIL